LDSRTVTAIVAVGLLTAAWPLIPLGSAEECQRVDVAVSEASCGTMVSASATGDARGTDCTEHKMCTSASGTSDATNDVGAFSCGAVGGAGCIAVSGTGDASNDARLPVLRLLRGCGLHRG
jgi:hypothetical protein